MNCIYLIGRAGAEARLEYTQSGMAICKFSIATSYRPKNGEEKTTWHDVVLFGKSAERNGPLISKGCKVFVKGRLEKNKWQDKDGAQRVSVTVVADWAEPIPYAGSEQSQQGGPNYTEDDIPF